MPPAPHRGGRAAPAHAPASRAPRSGRAVAARAAARRGAAAHSGLRRHRPRQAGRCRSSTRSDFRRETPGTGADGRRIVPPRARSRPQRRPRGRWPRRRRCSAVPGKTPCTASREPGALRTTSRKLRAATSYRPASNAATPSLYRSTGETWATAAVAARAASAAHRARSGAARLRRRPNATTLCCYPPAPPNCSRSGRRPCCCCCRCACAGTAACRRAGSRPRCCPAGTCP